MGKFRYSVVVAGAVGFLACFAVACGSDDTSDDVAYAEDLWLEVMDHDSWGLMPGTMDFEPSSAPHGAFTRIFINDVAAMDTMEFADQSVIVKRNYQSQTEDDYDSLTVMNKRTGYSPTAGDWFWVKYDLDGNIARDAEGRPLAGRIGLDETMGCIPCHMGAPGNDYVFHN